MKFHTTTDGKKLLISELSDDHLKNIIETLFRHLTAASNIVNAKAEDTRRIDLIGSGLTVKNFKKQSEQKIQEILDQLPFYIYESSIRGVHYTEKLQALHDRKAKSEYFAGADFAALSSPDTF